jgi:tetratricopeptide (TPR) repeat protein
LELRNNPNHAQALTYLGDVDMRMSHPEAALPLLKKAIQIDPAIELSHLDLGILDADAGNRDEALRELKIAARLAPEDVNVHWRLGRLYMAMGNREEAKAEMEKARTLIKTVDDALVKRMNPHLTPAQPPSETSAGK